MFDWSISLGTILTMATIITSVAAVVAMLRVRVDQLGQRMMAVEDSMKQLVQVLIEQGRQDERMNVLQTIMSAQGQRLDDLARKVDALYMPMPKIIPK
jgi:hypothetical protein